MLMSRREWFRNAAMIAAGVVAADQIDLLERLTHRKVFALGGIPDQHMTATEIVKREREFWLRNAPDVTKMYPVDLSLMSGIVFDGKGNWAIYPAPR